MSELEKRRLDTGYRETVKGEERETEGDERIERAAKRKVR